MPITRRIFLRNGALAAIGTAALPSFLTRAAYGAADPGTRARRLVVIFQRGAADGLNIVVPHAEPAYYAMRPTINIPQQSVLDLDGFFGLHPAMSSFQPLWDQKHLAIVHASGSPDPTRSHFDAQDFMESGTPGLKTTDDGWLNRCLRELPAPKISAVPSATSSSADASAFRAIALGPSLPRILSGREPAVAINNLNDFSVGGNNPKVQPISNTFEAMYSSSVDTVLHGTGRETFDAVKMLKTADPSKYTPAAGANYPKGRFGDSLRQLAQLIKANVGVQVAFADIGGWDHHVNEGSTQGQIANVLGDFSQSIAAFWTDLGSLGEDTVVVTMSEFGRTARENGNRGTDHGHANVMFVLGGPVRGGRVYGRWPGLDQSQLYEGRDLAITTDFRAVLSEVVSRYLGNKDLKAVFPGFDLPTQFLNLLG
ncbi:MAG TPA: DUF1501 domain-containing protein [Terriglobales bacterium]|nr:DUF1501 domain-containing protein [Terriglobales bacterium]